MLYALQRDDDPYLEIVHRYDNDGPQGERDIDMFVQAFHQLQQGMAETDADLLGEVYEQLAMTSDAFGQYFTPHSVCEAMAAMQIEAAEDRDSEDPFTVHDPACGSGRLLIAAMKQYQGLNAVYSGQDKDATCAKMTALNLCFFNVDGYAIHDDSLKVERRRMWQTSYSPIGGAVRELDGDEFSNPYAEAKAENVDSDSRSAGENVEQDSQSEQVEEVAVAAESIDGEPDVTLRQASMERWS